MDINSIKSEFRDYIVQKQLKEDPKGEIDYNVSIFKYASEFKEFLQDEYNIQPANVNIANLSNLEYEGDTVTFSNTKKESEIEEDSVNDPNSEENNSFIPTTEDLINEFFSDETVKNFSDLNNNGELSEDEIKAVLKSISDRDGNKNDISLEDLSALYEILYLPL